MTAEDKTVIANFLGLASDFIRDGHKRNCPTIQSSSDDFTSLPLAYQIDEIAEVDSSTDSWESNSVESYSAESDSLETIAADIRCCKACALASTRTNTVPGEGVNHPLVMVIGEGPGADEDMAGRPFVGKAGQLLDKMLQSIGLFRNKNCFIANVVKCRPPGNRDPEAEETSACSTFLERQIRLLRPQVILCAGRVAAQNLLKTSMGIKALRGEFVEFRLISTTKLTSEEIIIPVLCIFHPSALLRDESLKRPAWEDLKLLKSRLEERD